MSADAASRPRVRLLANWLCYILATGVTGICSTVIARLIDGDPLDRVVAMAIFLGGVGAAFASLVLVAPVLTAWGTLHFLSALPGQTNDGIGALFFLSLPATVAALAGALVLLLGQDFAHEVRLWTVATVVSVAGLTTLHLIFQGGS